VSTQIACRFQAIASAGLVTRRQQPLTMNQFLQIGNQRVGVQLLVVLRTLHEAQSD
jgi:hypothetical protein